MPPNLLIIVNYNENATILQGHNGKVLYQIVHGDQQNQFSIDDSTGMISVGKVLDREMISSYGKFCKNFVLNPLCEGGISKTLNIILFL